MKGKAGSHASAVPALRPVRHSERPRPSTIELPAQSYAFSQASLLTESQFIAEARKRGVSLEKGELEQLHRRRVLVPFYRIHARPIGPGRHIAPDRQVAGEGWRLYQASGEGTLGDPAQHRFTKWRTGPSGAGIYYSHYQLLSLRASNFSRHA